jgi:hypothetical protein
MKWFLTRLPKTIEVHHFDLVFLSVTAWLLEVNEKEANSGRKIYLNLSYWAIFFGTEGNRTRSTYFDTSIGQIPKFSLVNQGIGKFSNLMNANAMLCYQIFNQKECASHDR